MNPSKLHPLSVRPDLRAVRLKPDWANAAVKEMAVHKLINQSFICSSVVKDNLLLAEVKQSGGSPRLGLPEKKRLKFPQTVKFKDFISP